MWSHWRSPCSPLLWHALTRTSTTLKQALAVLELVKEAVKQAGRDGSPLKIYTDSSGQCTGSFLCQEAADLKVSIRFTTPWNVSTHSPTRGKVSRLSFLAHWHGPPTPKGIHHTTQTRPQLWERWAQGSTLTMLMRTCWESRSPPSFKKWNYAIHRSFLHRAASHVSVGFTKVSRVKQRIMCATPHDTGRAEYWFSSAQQPHNSKNFPL